MSSLCVCSVGVQCGCALREFASLCMLDVYLARVLNVCTAVGVSLMLCALFMPCVCMGVLSVGVLNVRACT